MPSREELEERIRQLEAENNELKDKLDLIYSIVAPDDEDEDDESGSGLVQISGAR